MCTALEHGVKIWYLYTLSRAGSKESFHGQHLPAQAGSEEIWYATPAHKIARENYVLLSVRMRRIEKQAFLSAAFAQKKK